MAPVDKMDLTAGRADQVGRTDADHDPNYVHRLTQTDTICVVDLGRPAGDALKGLSHYLIIITHEASRKTRCFVSEAQLTESIAVLSIWRPFASPADQETPGMD
jgi:hypothetical protein